MERSEAPQIIAAMLVLGAIISFPFILKNDLGEVPKAMIFSVAFILIVVLAKKSMANALDSDVEHEIWKVSRYGLKPNWHFDKPILAGIILPIFISLFSLGVAVVPTLLTYETRALKRRAAKRFGHYSYTEMTDWHIALIGAAGIISALVISIILYSTKYNLEYFAIISTLYAFFNMVPISKLDGAQIFYGSRLLWTTLALITALFVIYATLIAVHII
ncbi:MAG: hypothetical protein Q8Q31_01435 [Nanoarchaeota archaeon]|nr:hypothetical protein [Nanoarchaeota archaeon]